MGLWMFGSDGPFRPDLAVMHCLSPDYKKIDDTRSRLDLVEMHWLAPANAAPLRQRHEALARDHGWPRQAPRPSGARLRMYRQSSTLPIFTSQTGQHPFIFTARFTNFRYWEALGRLLDYTVYFNLFDLRFSLQTVPSTRRISI